VHATRCPPVWFVKYSSRGACAMSDRATDAPSCGRLKVKRTTPLIRSWFLSSLTTYVTRRHDTSPRNDHAHSAVSTFRTGRTRANKRVTLGPGGCEGHSPSFTDWQSCSGEETGSETESARRRGLQRRVCPLYDDECRSLLLLLLLLLQELLLLLLPCPRMSDCTDDQ